MICLLQLHRHLLDLSGELVVALGIVLGHGSGFVRAHIGGLVGRKEKRRSISDPTLGYLGVATKNLVRRVGSYT